MTRAHLLRLEVRVRVRVRVRVTNPNPNHLGARSYGTVTGQSRSSLGMRG